MERDAAGHEGQCKQMMDRDNPDIPKPALSALLAVVTADYALSEALALFVGDPDERPAGEACCGEAMIRAVDWCMGVLQVDGSLARGDETMAEMAAAEIVRRAGGLIVTVSPRGAEAFFLSALALIVDDFCALWQATGRRCGDTPMPGLRSALAACLAHGYGLDLDAPGSNWVAVLSAAGDVRRCWCLWACVPTPRVP